MSPDKAKNGSDTLETLFLVQCSSFPIGPALALDIFTIIGQEQFSGSRVTFSIRPSDPVATNRAGGKNRPPPTPLLVP